MEKTLLLKRTTGNGFSIPNLFYVGLYLVVHSLNAHNFDLEGELLRTTSRLMAASATPDKGMLMGIPVGGGFLDRFLDLLPVDPRVCP
jgi:hypothetical protein